MDPQNHLVPFFPKSLHFVVGPDFISATWSKNGHFFNFAPLMYKRGAREKTNFFLKVTGHLGPIYIPSGVSIGSVVVEKIAKNYQNLTKRTPLSFLT